MNIVAFPSATLICLFPLEEFTPIAGGGQRSTLSAIAERYSFARLPSIMSPEELSESGLTFEIGEVPGILEPTNIVKLSIHNDGLVIGSTTTEAAQRIFDDLYGWLRGEWGYRHIRPKTLFISEVVVEFSQPVSRFFNHYDRLMSTVLRHIKMDNDDISGGSFGGLYFDLHTSLSRQVRFRFERRAGSNPEQERYFSSAPLQTLSHVAMLRELEQLIA